MFKNKGESQEYEEVTYSIPATPLTAKEVKLITRLERSRVILLAISLLFYTTGAVLFALGLGYTIFSIESVATIAILCLSSSLLGVAAEGLKSLAEKHALRVQLLQYRWKRFNNKHFS